MNTSLLAALVFAGATVLAAEPEPVNPGGAVGKMDGLVAFWDFQEAAGQARVSSGLQSFALSEAEMLALAQRVPLPIKTESR